MDILSQTAGTIATHKRGGLRRRREAIKAVPPGAYDDSVGDQEDESTSWVYEARDGRSAAADDYMALAGGCRARQQ